MVSVYLISFSTFLLTEDTFVSKKIITNFNFFLVVQDEELFVELFRKGTIYVTFYS